MPPLRMTRADYEKTYGIKPVISTSTLDTTPAPLRMTRDEYQMLYGEVSRPEPGLGGKLLNRAKDAITAPFRKQSFPGQMMLNVAGDVGGAVGDIYGAVLGPAVEKTADVISEIPAVQKLANWKPMSKGLDAVNADMEYAGEMYQGFKKESPVIARTAEDLANLLNILPLKGAKLPEGVKTKVINALDERVIAKREEELFNIESNYSKTRKANEYSSDSGAASRRRIAATDVLVDAVDAEGTIRTKVRGGAVDQYRAQTIDGVEDIVRRNLEFNAETVPLPTIKSALIAEIGRSGLEGGDLVQALRGVERELKGLTIRAKDGVIPLEKVHDAKISTTRNIDFNTPPETKAYRKAVARAYKTVVEEGSTKFDVSPVNRELTKYYGDLERLENLDGRKVKGGRLGKYFAQVSGNLIGGAAGSVGGPVGVALGGALGGEAASLIKGKQLSSSFGRGLGKNAPKNPILEKARLNVPDKKVAAPKGVPKTKEISRIEKDIAKNVDDQAKAIKKGDFALVQALKEIYQALVARLKAEIALVREMASKEGQRGFANFFGGQSYNLGKRNTMYSPTKTKNNTVIKDTVAPKAESATKLSTPLTYEEKDALLERLFNSSARDLTSDSPSSMTITGTLETLDLDLAAKLEDFQAKAKKARGLTEREYAELKNTFDSIDLNTKGKEWTGTESSKPSTDTSTSISKKPTERGDGSAPSADTSGGFSGLEAAAKGKTLEEFVASQKDNLLFHGTTEEIKGNLRGGVDGVVWTTNRPDLSQSYIKSDKGRLYAFSNTKDLKIYDATGIGNDLTNPTYNNQKLIEKVKAAGYDGIKIDDFLQDKNWGNVGHQSIGLFESGLKKVKPVGSIEAGQFTFGDRLTRTDTTEYKALLKSIWENAQK